MLRVYEAGKKAVEQCRQGLGPVFLECLTYRFRGHVGPDDNLQGNHTDIRPQEEMDSWLQQDPIKRFEDYLLSNNLLAEKKLEAIRREAETEVAQSHAFAKESSLPYQEESRRHVFK